MSSSEVNEFFAGEPLAKELFMVVGRAVEAAGDAAVRVTKSQIAFRRHGTFAAIWLPGRYLRGASAPLVLTVFLPFRDGSPRWKQVVEPAPGRFTHHLEVWRAADIDEEVEGWLRSAWDAA